MVWGGLWDLHFLYDASKIMRKGFGNFRIVQINSKLITRHVGCFLCLICVKSFFVRLF